MHVDIPSPRRVLCALDVGGSPSGALSVASLNVERFPRTIRASGSTGKRSLAETGTFDVVVAGLHDGAAAGDALVGSLRRRSGVSVLSVRALTENCIFTGGALKAPRVSNDVNVYGVPA